MAVRNDFWADSSNGHSRLHIAEWLPEGTPRGVVQICHGMTEHIGCYERLAAALAAAGYVVAGNDHLGHGLTAENDAVDGKPLFGYFGEVNGAAYLVEDTHVVRCALSERYPGLPHYLLGHSMGSYVSRNYVSLYGRHLSGYICSSTSEARPLLSVLLAVTNVLCALGKGKHLARRISRLLFKRYNKPFAPAVTGREWLTRDTAYYPALDADRYCRFTFTNAGFRDLFRLLGACSGKNWAASVPQGLPVLLVAGSADPVSRGGRDVRVVYDDLVECGLTDVTIKIYPEARHELHNELCREEYIADLLAWLDARSRKERNGDHEA